MNQVGKASIVAVGAVSATVTGMIIG